MAFSLVFSEDENDVFRVSRSAMISLANLTKSDKAKVEAAIKELTADYNEANKGIGLQRIDNKVQMVTGSDNAQLVKNFIKEETRY